MNILASLIIAGIVTTTLMLLLGALMWHCIQMVNAVIELEGGDL